MKLLLNRNANNEDNADKMTLKWSERAKKNIERYK